MNLDELLALFVRDLKNWLPPLGSIGTTVHPRSRAPEDMEDIYILTKLVKILEFYLANGMEQQHEVNEESKKSHRFKSVANMFVYVQLLQSRHGFDSNGAIFQSFKGLYRRQAQHFLE